MYKFSPSMSFPPIRAFGGTDPSLPGSHCGPGVPFVGAATVGVGFILGYDGAMKPGTGAGCSWFSDGGRFHPTAGIPFQGPFKGQLFNYVFVFTLTIYIHLELHVAGKTSIRSDQRDQSLVVLGILYILGKLSSPDDPMAVCVRHQ